MAKNSSSDLQGHSGSSLVRS